MMEKLHINPTDMTPEVILDPDNGVIQFSGVSFPEDINEFYIPIFTWLENYSKEPVESDLKKIVCDFRFEYLNSASFIVLRDILKYLIQKSETSGLPLEVNWYYPKDDVDIFEIAREVEELFDVSFNYKELPPQKER